MLLITTKSALTKKKKKKKKYFNLIPHTETSSQRTNNNTITPPPNQTKVRDARVTTQPISLFRRFLPPQRFSLPQVRSNSSIEHGPKLCVCCLLSPPPPTCTVHPYVEFEACLGRDLRLHRGFGTIMLYVVCCEKTKLLNQGLPSK